MAGSSQPGGPPAFLVDPSGTNGGAILREVHRRVERLISRTVPGLNSGNVTVLAHTAPRDLPERSEAIFRLPESETAEGLESPLLRALALAEPREVPMRIWAELADR